MNKYKKDLGDNYERYKIASYLFAQGLGIGSYAYLRRVFEDILKEMAIQKFSTVEGWNYDEWKIGKRTEDVIEELKDELPEFLVENKARIYGLLSKGLHQLEEDECLKLFPTLQGSIEEILEDKVTAKARENRRIRIKGEIESV